MPVFALANQKGGVAKTTTTLSLGAAFAAAGDRVLMIDCDPQAALTYSMGVDPDELQISLHDVLTGRAQLAEVLWEQHGCHVAAATIDLAGSEAYLLTKTGREFALAKALRSVRDAYDVVLIDCPPSLGILTINALTAADEVLIPLQCESLSQRGMGQLLETIEDVRSFTNPDLRIRGVIATMYDPRTNHAQKILANVSERFGLEVIGEPVRKSIRFAEAPERGETIFERAPNIPGAQAYRTIATELRTWADEPETTATEPGAPAATTPDASASDTTTPEPVASDTTTPEPVATVTYGE